MNNNANSPFGVKLKSAGLREVIEKDHHRFGWPTSTQTRLPEDATAEQTLNQYREGLRKTPPSPTKPHSVSAATKYNRPGRGEPFTLVSSSPTKSLFGVVLRSHTASTSDKEKEEYFDLDLAGSTVDDGSPAVAAADSPSFSQKEEEESQLFGVRLKPTRRPYQRSGWNRTYQLDLNPPPLPAGGGRTYHPVSPETRSFLEVRLRPVPRPDNDPEQPAPVELQLRHVVAPADGGPKRAVTEARLQIPLLRKVPPLQSNQRRTWRQDPLQDLLQLTLQSLKHVSPNRYQPSDPQVLQIRLRHVNPETQQTQDVPQTIEVELNPVGSLTSSSGSNAALSPSMQVTLRHVLPEENRPNNNNSEEPTTPEFGKIQLKSVHCQEEEEHEPDTCEDDDGESKKELLVQDLQEESVEPGLADNEDNDVEEMFQSSLPNIARLDDSSISMTPPHTPPKEEEPQIVPKEVDPHPPPKASSDRKPSKEKEPQVVPKEVDPYPPPKPSSDSRPSAPQRQRSRSLNDMQRAGRRNNKAVDNEKEEGLSDTRCRDLLMWYNRMKMPNKEEMKRRVAKLPDSCDITPEDVELLPWRCGDRFLDLRVMNQYFLEGWQGAKK